MLFLNQTFTLSEKQLSLYAAEEFRDELHMISYKRTEDLNKRKTICHREADNGEGRCQLGLL